MRETRGEELPQGLFKARAEHCPKTKEDLYERLNYYASWLGVAVSDALYECLVDLRNAASRISDEEIRNLALKAYTDEEYAAAVKEIMCIWFHQEAMDQGGDEAPEWLLSFLKQAFNASDYLIAEPKALDVMFSYEDFANIEAVCHESAARACRALGFGPLSPGFAAAIERVFLETAPKRQQILEEALTLPAETVRTRPLP